MAALDFELRISEPVGRKLRVEVLSSPAGEGQVETTFPYDTLALENRLQALQLALLAGSSRRRRMIGESERTVQQFGRELFESVFTGEVGSLLERSREQASLDGNELRIQLRFESADLASLPWEFLYDPNCGEYLCLSSSTPVVRYVELSQAQRPLAVSPPLRVLAMVASPSDLPALDAVQERSRIDAALQPLVEAGRLEVTWLEGQTWRHLQTALQTGTWHVFHLVGHGGFDTNRGEGIVAFCGDDGASHVLGATDLGRLLGDHGPLRLAVLNSCEGARGDRLDVFSSTATVLVRRGTPAVIAMQYEITDLAAVELARSFYAAVAAGMPVDAALGEARKAVSLALPGTLEWGTPVLYLRAPDGRIFDIDPATVPPLAAGASRSRPASLPAADEVEPVTVGAGGSNGGPRRTDLLRRRWPVAAGAAAAVAVAVIALLSFLLLSDDESDGLGLTELAVAHDGGIESHQIILPADSVAFVTVRPVDGDLDPDLGVATSRSEAQRLDDFLGRAGFDLDIFEGAFDDYDGPRVGQVVARVDEGAADDEEQLLLTAPFGGRFEIVVAGAGDTSGRFDLTVERRALDTPTNADEYIELLLEDRGVERFLSDGALEMLADTASINLPFVDLDFGDGDLGLDESVDIEGLLGAGGADTEMFGCLMDQLSEAFGIDLENPEDIGNPEDLDRLAEIDPEDPEVQSAVEACEP